MRQKEPPQVFEKASVMQPRDMSLQAVAKLAHEMRAHQACEQRLLRQQAQGYIAGAAGQREQTQERLMHGGWGCLGIHVRPALLTHQPGFVQVSRLHMNTPASGHSPVIIIPDHRHAA